MSQCHRCMKEFSSRQGLKYHLTRKKTPCMSLNKPDKLDKTDEEVDEERTKNIINITLPMDDERKLEEFIRPIRDRIVARICDSIFGPETLTK